MFCSLVVTSQRKLLNVVYCFVVQIVISSILLGDFLFGCTCRCSLHIYRLATHSSSIVLLHVQWQQLCRSFFIIVMVHFEREDVTGQVLFPTMWVRTFGEMQHHTNANTSLGFLKKNRCWRLIPDFLQQEKMLEIISLINNDKHLKAVFWHLKLLLTCHKSARVLIVYEFRLKVRSQSTKFVKRPVIFRKHLHCLKFSCWCNQQ